MGNAKKYSDNSTFCLSNQDVIKHLDKDSVSFVKYERDYDYTLNKSANHEIDNPYGVFIRMQTINPANYQYIVDALVKAKVKVVNIQIYSYVLNLENESKFVKLLNEVGIDVLFRYIWIPRFNTLSKVKSSVSVSVEQWEKYLLKALQEFDGQDGRPYVKYINFFDEPQLFYRQDGRSTFKCVDLVEIYKRGYQIVKKNRPDMIVASTTICSYDEDFFNDLFTVKLNDGLKYYNFIDILYLDYYANRITDLYPEIKKIYDSLEQLQPELLKRPMWYCCGTTSYNRLPDARAETQVKYMITALSMGAEIFNLYSFVMGGGCSMKDSDTDYYGIIAPSVKNSYVSLLRVSNPDKSIGEGDAFKKVYLGCPDTYPQTTFDFCYFRMNKSMVDMVKKEGLIISGKSFSFTKVIISDGSSSKEDFHAKDTLFEGYYSIGPNGENSLIIPSSRFDNLQVGNRIILFYDRSSSDVSNEWSGLETYKAFDSFIALQYFFKPRSTRPQIKKVDDLYIACWLNDDGNTIFCIYRADFAKPKNYSFSYEGTPVIYDVYSNRIYKQLENIDIGSAPIYIKGIDKLKVNK